MRRPFYLTTTPALPMGWRRRTYATESSAVRHAKEIVAAFPLVVVSIRKRIDDCSDFIRGVAHPQYREFLEQSRAEAARGGEL